jgi:hypothetical protein
VLVGGVRRRMVLRGFIGMCFRVRRVPFRGVRMMGRRFVLALFVMLGRLVMMLRRRLVMMSGLLIIVRTLMICLCRLLVLRNGSSAPPGALPLLAFHAVKRHRWKTLS